MKTKIEVTLKDDWRERIAKIIGEKEYVEKTRLILKEYRDMQLITDYIYASIKDLNTSGLLCSISHDENIVTMEWIVTSEIRFDCLADYLEAIITLPLIEATIIDARYYVNRLLPDKKEDIKHMINLLRAMPEEGDNDE